MSPEGPGGYPPGPLFCLRFSESIRAGASRCREAQLLLLSSEGNIIGDCDLDCIKRSVLVWPAQNKLMYNCNNLSYSALWS